MHVGTKGCQRRVTDSVDLETEPSVVLLDLTDEGGQNTEGTPSSGTADRTVGGVSRTTVAPRGQQHLKYKTKRLCS